MPEDETTQQPGVEATPPAVEEPTGTAEAPTTEGQEPEAPTTESLEEVTPERFAELQNYEKRYKDIESYKTQLEQERATRDQELQDRQQELERMRRSMAEMIGHQRAQADPLEAARQELIAAEQDWQNPERKAAAQERFNQIQFENMRRQVIADAQREMEAKRLLDEAQRTHGFKYTADQLAESAKNFDPVKLGVQRLFEEQGWEGVVKHGTEILEQRNSEAQRKQAINQILGSGGEGVMPGAMLQTGAKPTMDWMEWRGQYNAEARQKLLETHTIINAPEGFDQPG